MIGPNASNSLEHISVRLVELVMSPWEDLMSLGLTSSSCTKSPLFSSVSDEELQSIPLN